MNGYFIPFGARRIVSVNKKIDMQLQQFSTIAMIEEINVDIELKSFLRNALSVFPFIDLPWDYSEAYQKIDIPDFIFIRRTGADRRLIKFLKYIKNRFPNCKILMEVATYPYIKESLQRIEGCLLLPKDFYNERKLKKYVDKVVTYSDDATIWGIPTIRIMNGIVVEHVKPIYDVKAKEDNTIRLLAVAVFRKAHGYERCIKGLAEYYQNRPSRIIEIHIVGDGTELNYYKQLVMKYNLEKFVYFYGKKTGEVLDEIYNNKDIGLGAFGFYKVGMSRSSILKTREYLAKGLPVISGCIEDVFERTGNYQYFLQFSNDSSIVDMNEVVKFYERIYGSGIERNVVHKEIREFAEKNVGMKVVMKPVLQYLKGEEV